MPSEDIADVDCNPSPMYKVNCSTERRKQRRSLANAVFFLLIVLQKGMCLIYAHVPRRRNQRPNEGPGRTKGPRPERHYW